MEFLRHHRDRPGSLLLRGELLEALGCTMGEFPGGPAGGDRFPVLGFGEGRAAALTEPPGRDELIAYGPLLSDDGTAWLGTAAQLRAPEADAARAVLTVDRYAAVEVHAWEFGGRR